MAEPVALPPLAAEAAARLAEFARTCKAAARAVSLYPGNHPAIGVSLGRLAEITARLTEGGPYRLQVRVDTLLLDGAAASKPDPAIAELADVLYKHRIGSFTLNAGADAESWRTLLLLVARAPDDVQTDGGIGRLWSTAGGPSIELQEIDYAEVLREKRGLAETIEQILAAALAGPQLELDDTLMTALMEIVEDPAKLDELMKQLHEAGAGAGVEARVAAFIQLLRGIAERAGRQGPDRIDAAFRQMGHAAGRLSAEEMMSLLGHRERPEAIAGAVDVVDAVVSRMGDTSVAQFVAGSVIAERGATDRLAEAFQNLVPEFDRQRQLLALAQGEVAQSELGQEDTFSQLWERVETMLTSYSDKDFVSGAYARELSNARSQAIEVERTSDDPPERLAAWLTTVSDSALRHLDHHLLMDLLTIEPDPLRWRDVAETVLTHADDLIRVGQIDQAWRLAESVVEQASQRPEREPHCGAVLERFGRGAMMKHVAAHLRGAGEEDYARFKRLCHAIGTPIIAPLAEVLSAERDARSRRRLRDVLVGFGARGRDAVQQLMSARNWEVRRTAAYLLREFGGAEGLKELIPLLTDTEPLVQREAVQGLVLNGSDQASAILAHALATASGRTRETLISELLGMRDERAAPAFCYLLKHLDRRKLPGVYFAAVEALGTFGGPDAVDALKGALYQGEWWAPFATRRLRAAVAGSLRKIGTPAAIEALRSASSQGSRGVRTAARDALAGIE